MIKKGKGNLLQKTALAAYKLAVVFAALIAAPTAGQAEPQTAANAAAIPIPVLSVRLTSPNGGEVWKAGEKREITWVVSEGADITSITIRCSTDSGSTTELVTGLQGNPASYTWNIPHLTSTTCLVLIEVSDSKGNRARDQSDSTFTIAKPDSRPELATSLESSEKVAFVKSLSITVTVKNTGTAPSPESRCEVIVRNAHAPRQLLRKFEKKIRELTAGDSFSFSSPLKLGIGLFEICATVDPKNRIPEQDEANNRSCITIAGK
jgi:hypothetical protein